MMDFVRCGGCGNADPDNVCIGCRHDFDPPTCFVCEVPFKNGDMVISDITEGLMHTACCGSERESYVDRNGDPLAPDAAIPTGWRYSP